ncbi:fluoroquinolone transporter permease [Amycolatopsis anabasis]|uniref:fluoroquinolone export ABC transporter permease subunit n=1 Tax=Amycolatopsis anabasis TaxID=1840409 RepID=UPI00131BA5A5|nr:fluoroquinolone transporter permease [Amycolatopsis anabasis]
MNRATAVLRLEIRLQWRYRLLHAAVFSGLLWLALLLPLSPELRSTAEPYVMLGDLAIVGYYFIAGAMFFEKGERTLQAVVSTPLRFGEYLLSKVATLTALSVVLAVFVATATHGLDYDLPMLLLGAALGTVLLLLTGFLSAMPFKTVSDWFLPAIGPVAVLNLPIFHYSGIWETPWFYLIPTQGPLLFLGAAFGQKNLAAWQIAYGVLYPVLFAGLLCLLARRMFAKYVVGKVGGA